MLPSDFIRPQYHLPKLRGRQDLLDFRDFFCLHFEFPEEIENTNRFAKGGKGQRSDVGSQGSEKDSGLKYLGMNAFGKDRNFIG